MKYAVYALAGATLGALAFAAAVGVGAIAQALRADEDQ